MKVSCSVLFNHPYPPNIPVLRELYKDKFDEVSFIQPLRSSPDPDVYTSYRGSFAFHGMITDAAERLLAKDADYFIFVHDDVLLNPLYNGEQLVERLQVPGNGAFIPYLFSLHPDAQDWVWMPGFLWRLFYPTNQLSGTGIENLISYFPNAETMRAKFDEIYGLSFENITYDRTRPINPIVVVGNQSHGNYITKSVLDGLYVTAEGASSVQLPFPFIGGNCDFTVLDRKTLEAVVPLLGVTAAANLFVEIAMPTAIACAADRVVQSKDVGLFAEMAWTKEEQRLMTDDILVRRFNEDLLLFHPFKLSAEKKRLENVIERTLAYSR